MITLRPISVKFSVCLFLFLLLGFSSFSQTKKLSTEEGLVRFRNVLQKKGDKVDALNTFIQKENVHTYVNRESWHKVMVECGKELAHQGGDRQAEAYATLAAVLRGEGYNREAYYYFYKTERILKEYTPENQEFVKHFHWNYGLSLMYFQRYEKARTHFRTARPQLNKNGDPNFIMSYNNVMGLLNMKQGYLDSARICFQNALAVTKSEKFEVWEGIISGNLATYYLRVGDLNKAYELFQTDVRLSGKHHEIGSMFGALEQLIEIDLKLNRLENVRENESLLDSLIGTMKMDISRRVGYYRTKSQIAEAFGQHKQAMDYYRQHITYRDSTEKFSEHDKLEKTEFQLDVEHKLSEIQLLKERKRFDDLVIYGLTGGTIALMIVFTIIVNQISKRRKREGELAQLRRQLMHDELKNTEREMHKMLANLMEKSTLIEKLSDEIQEYKDSSEESSQTEERLHMVERLQSFTLLTDDDWFEFKLLFEKLNPTFFNKVYKYAPDLTNAEIRLVTLIKLNLSSIEMSKVLGISPDSVRKTSLRLRKKWNMEQPEELLKFIMSL